MNQIKYKGSWILGDQPIQPKRKRSQVWCVTIGIYEPGGFTYWIL